MINPHSLVWKFSDIDRTALPLAGGKGANLGELYKLDGIHVPDGFCISTLAFQRILNNTSVIGELLEQLSVLKVTDKEAIHTLSSRIRSTIESAVIPDDIQTSIRQLLAGKEGTAYAVRSSATAEDLPNASFAGQQDTYLNITGEAAILQHISWCWASLFTERAIIYRIQQGFDHRKVHLAVVVQEMVFPEAAGILFTADPVTGDRNISCIDAGYGLGEAMVAGLVNADHYKVRDGQVIEQQIATKQLAIYARQQGGVKEVTLDPALQSKPVLTTAQMLALAAIGSRIAAHFGSPQDIEWCLANETFYIVQSRPVTTLYPVPVVHDEQRHVYVSVGHQQMMTDPLKPLGLSLFQLTTPRPMYAAAGRLFVDIAPNMATTAGREAIINALGQSDPLIKDALHTLVERNFIPLLPEEEQPHGAKEKAQLFPGIPTITEGDPALVDELIARSEASIAELTAQIQTKSGVEVFDFILNDLDQLRTTLFDPRILGVVIAAMNACIWINEKMEQWLGEKGMADTLSQSAPNNVTSEMGLALMDVADVIRPYPEVISYLQQIKNDDFLEGLLPLPGGPASREAVYAFLRKYGMRCIGEIDITRTRWSEKPAALVPMILSNIRNFEPGAAARKFAQGLEEAARKEQELLTRLRDLPDGAEKVGETKRMIDMIRNFVGYREYPKYSKICRYYAYKQALMKEVALLIQAGALGTKEDSYYLTFEELREAVRTQHIDNTMIDQRKAAYQLFEKLTPPRVMTSEGEVIAGKYKRENVPANALVGLAVSSGVVEGRARVILRVEEANIEEGDILVTTFTDPSWTPLFVSIKGLITEVGGLMTHGAVIAREYGLPAVVGVEQATKLIKEGQRIRLNGTNGTVEIL
ncbi:MAG: phosphoenolpyruvate synthase [Chitinophaga sp.]|uniref:phosphoenolpyruvate synthase n=1 Tax=Chitinophaga sp. TaxID=1869181 RepID=UPI001B1A2548|nr:phosphoenolpyruvate synthase [Chitinophaga sp.]MBO9728420.1 phosphoenolpyruvate synthase [Chitinophaga sp.]